MGNDSFLFNQSWEEREFSRQEYTSLLRQLAEKGKSDALSVDNHSLRIIGRVAYIWQQVKGIFGFENTTHPVRVNLELLKFLRYGKTHAFLEEPTINHLVSKLQDTLSQEKQHEKIAHILKNAFSPALNIDADKILDREIYTYCKTNEAILGEAFWPRLFYRFIAPVKHDAAYVSYNLGRIHAANGEYEKGVNCLQEAIKMSPDKLEWQLVLAKTHMTQVENHIEHHHFVEASISCDQALKILNQIPRTDTHTIPLIKAAYVHKLALQVKLGKNAQAIQTLKEGCTILGFQPASILEDYEEDLITKTEPTNTQIGSLYFALAQDESFKYAQAFLSKAIDMLDLGIKKEADSHASEKLIAAYLQLGKLYQDLGQLENAEKFFSQAVNHFEYLKLYFPPSASSLVSSQILTCMRNLVQQHEQQKDWPGCIRVLQKMQPFLQEDPVERAHSCYTLAKLYHQQGLLYSALLEAEKAHTLIPKEEYAKFVSNLITTLANDAEGDSLIQPQEAQLGEISGCLERIMKSFSNLSKTQLLLLKISFAQAEKSTSIQKFLEACALYDKCLASLKKLLAGNDNNTSIMRLQELMSACYVSKFAIFIKLQNLPQAVNIFNEGLKALKLDSEAFLDMYEDFIINTAAVVPPNDLLGTLYLQLATEEINPETAKALFLKSIACLEQATSQQGLDPKIIQNLIQANIEVCQRYLDAHEWEKAKKHLSQAHTHFLDASQLFTSSTKAPVRAQLIKISKTLAEKFQSQGNLQGVLHILFQLKDFLVDNRQEFAENSFKLAMVYRDLGDLPSSLKEAEQSNTLDPACAAYAKLLQELATALANDAIGHADHQKSLENLEKAHAAAPKDWLIHFQLVSSYAKLNRWNDAEKSGGKLVEIYPNRYEGHTLFSHILNNQDKQQEALIQAREAVRLAPQVPQCLSQLYECLMRSADEQMRGADHPQALAHLKEALKLFPEKSSEVAKKLVAYGDQIAASNEILAAEAYESALPNFYAIFLNPQSQCRIYHLLANEKHKKGHYAAAIAYYQQAVKFDPNNLDIHNALLQSYQANRDYKGAEAELKRVIALYPQNIRLLEKLGKLYQEQNLFDKALPVFAKCVSLEPANVGLLKKLTAAEVEAGNQYLAKGSSDPEITRQMILDLVNHVLTSPVKDAFCKALGGRWEKLIGLSRDNKDFPKLGQNAKTPHEIEIAVKRALEIIEKAFNGKPPHMKKEQMPKEFSTRMQALRLQLASMKSHYGKLQQTTEELVELARSTGFNQLFTAWTHSPPIEDLSTARLIEQRARQVLDIIDPAMGASHKIISDELRKKADTIRRLLSSFSWADLAIPHYLAACKLLPDEYGEHLNKLIDAYIQIGDYKNAIAAYEEFKAAFPKLPININPEAYVKSTEQLVQQEQLPQAHTFILDATKKFPEDTSLKKCLSHVLFRIGAAFHTKKDYASALKFYDQSLNCGVEAEHACYAGLAELHKQAHDDKIDLSTNKKGGLDWNTSKLYHAKMINYMKKAAELAPNNAAYQYHVGKCLYWDSLHSAQHNPVPYFERAVELDPKNVVYAAGLLMSLDRADDPRFEKAISHFKSLGGAMVHNYWEDE